MNKEQAKIVIQNTPDILAPKSGEVGGPPAELISALLPRALHSAREEDYVILPEKTPEDFLQYFETITGHLPKVTRFEGHKGSVSTDQMLCSIQQSGIQASLNPYIQSERVAGFAKTAGLEMTFTPTETLLQTKIVEKANDKVYFRERAAELDIPLVSPQTIICVTTEQGLDEKGIEEVSTATINYIRNFGGVFLQANLSGGGVGNLDIQEKNGAMYSQKLTSNQLSDEQSTQKAVQNWIQSQVERGSTHVIVAPYLDLIATYTVSGFVTEHGKPYVYGVFWQKVAENTHDYHGFEWPIEPQDCNPQTQEFHRIMCEAAYKWFYHLQQAGYRGPSDVDYIIGRKPKNPEQIVIGASESNTRWDAFSFSLNHIARVNGGDRLTLKDVRESRLAISAHDHIPTRFSNTRSIIDELKREEIPLLGITNKKTGLVIITPPIYRKEKGCFEIALAAIGTTLDEAREILKASAATIKK